MTDHPLATMRKLDPEFMKHIEDRCPRLCRRRPAAQGQAPDGDGLRRGRRGPGRRPRPGRAGHEGRRDEGRDRRGPARRLPSVRRRLAVCRVFRPEGPLGLSAGRDLGRNTFWITECLNPRAPKPAVRRPSSRSPPPLVPCLRAAIASGVASLDQDEFRGLQARPGFREPDRQPPSPGPRGIHLGRDRARALPLRRLPFRIVRTTPRAFPSLKPRPCAWTRREAFGSARRPGWPVSKTTSS